MRRVEGQESEEREITHVSVHGGSSNVLDSVSGDSPAVERERERAESENEGHSTLAFQRLTAPCR